MITAKMVKDLREVTGAGMMDCKKALTEANGDSEKAIEILREKGLAAAAKKAGRTAAEGLVSTYVSENCKKASMVEVNCETDFVAVNKNFMEFSNTIAKQAADTDASSVEEFVNQKYALDTDKTISQALTELISKLGENMAVRRFKKIDVEKGAIASYIHGDGRIGVLVKVECDKDSDELKDIAKEVAMQVAATNPGFLDESSVNQEVLEKEKEIYRVQALNEGKPEKIVERMVEGRIKKFYKENCLVDQVWIKDSDLTISKYLQSKSKEVGAPIKVSDFVRFEKGEGIEKKEENFAEEVKKQMEGK
jgi:elongation factor Ts